MAKGIGLSVSVGVLLLLCAAVTTALLARQRPLENEPHFLDLELASGQKVTVSRSEITVAQWRECVADRACPEIATKTHLREDHPVTGVSFYDAMAYVQWLERRTGMAVALPSREEWTAIAADHRPPPKKKLFDDPKLAWAADYDITAPPRSQISSSVGSHGTNKHGIMDIKGNVWEWTRSCIRDHQGDCMDGRFAMGEHEAALSSLVRDPGNAGCGGGVPPSLLGFRLVVLR